MENYKIPITIFATLVIASFFFVQGFSSLMTSINTIKVEIQDKRLALSNEMRGLDDVLSKSRNYSIEPKALAKFDLKNGTNFFAEFSKPTLAYASSSSLTLGEQLYGHLKKEQQSKKSEEQKLKDLRVFSFIPPWQLLFVTGLGVFIVRLLNRSADLICDHGSAKPFHTILGVLLLFAAISVVICWF